MTYAIVTYRNEKYIVAAKTSDRMHARRNASGRGGRVFYAAHNTPDVGTEITVEELQAHVEIDI